MEVCIQERCHYLKEKKYLHETWMLHCDIYIPDCEWGTSTSHITCYTFIHYIIVRILRYLSPSLPLHSFYFHSLLYVFLYNERIHLSEKNKRKMKRKKKKKDILTFPFGLLLLMLLTSSGSFKWYVYDWRVENKHGQQKTAENFRVVKIYLLAHSSL